MSASRDRGTFDAGTVERVLDEFRADNPLVEQLFRVHQGEAPASELTREDAEAALSALKHTVCLALQHGNQHTEYLHYARGGWWSATETATRSVGPIPIYDHNVEDRLGEHEMEAAKVNHTPFAAVELPAHDLDPDENGVVLDV